MKGFGFKGQDLPFRGSFKVSLQRGSFQGSFLRVLL